MKDSMKCVESRQIHKEGYLHERREELKDNAGVRSILMASEKRGNDDNEYAGGLLERILDRDNMNRAYIRVCNQE